MRSATDPTNKALLLEMAQAWIRLAEQQRAGDQAQPEGQQSDDGSGDAE
jgi:hypothetical protein